MAQQCKERPRKKSLKVVHTVHSLPPPPELHSCSLYTSLSFRYRNLVTGEDVQPPIIPFYPVVKKDLTFIHLANDSKVENLVNFEKLRMIAKEVSSENSLLSYEVLNLIQMYIKVDITRDVS